MDDVVVWVIVAVVVLAIIAVVIYLMNRSRTERALEAQRTEARDLRESAEADRLDVQRREAEAARLDAQARVAQAEADARAADAAQLQADAQQRAQHAGGARADVDERLRRADEIDPDMPGVPEVPAVPPEGGRYAAAGDVDGGVDADRTVPTSDDGLVEGRGQHRAVDPDEPGRTL
jgi:FtsZ-interacting cell division protein ZipA